MICGRQPKLDKKSGKQTLEVVQEEMGSAVSSLLRVEFLATDLVVPTQTNHVAAQTTHVEESGIDDRFVCVATREQMETRLCFSWRRTVCIVGGERRNRLGTRRSGSACPDCRVVLAWQTTTFFV